jgi:hypothetical protein
VSRLLDKNLSSYGLVKDGYRRIDEVANEIDVVLKFFDSGMKIQDFN